MPNQNECNQESVLLLFDLDGTLTPSRANAPAVVLQALQQLRQRAIVGIVSGSDLSKVIAQLGLLNQESSSIDNYVDYIFAENGTVTRHRGKMIGQDMGICKILGDGAYNELVNFCLKYIAELDIPIKRGTFIELRSGVINISPIGRNCSWSERNDFEKFDKQHGIRQKFVEALRVKFESYNLHFAIGGQISIDCHLKGWDKRLSLDRIKDCMFQEIHFFGDKTFYGGNDYELYKDPRVIGHTVSSHEDTLQQLRLLNFLD